MKRLAVFLLIPLISACSAGDTGGVIPDAQAYLAGLGGPKVPSMSETMLKTAHDAEEMGNYRQAAVFYQQLADKYPDNQGYKIMLGDALRRGAEPDRALVVYDKALAQDPNMAKAKEGKALALLEKSDVDGAEKLLLGLKDSGHDSWRVENALGIIAASRQDTDKALAFFREALRLSPGNPSVLNNTGLEQALSKDSAAIATMSQAQTAAGDHALLREQVDLNTALVYAVFGKLDNAEEIARHYFQGAVLDNNLGFYAHVAKDDDLAKTYLNMALTQSKTFYQRAWNNLQAIDNENKFPAVNHAAQPKTVLIAPPETTLAAPVAPVEGATEKAASAPAASGKEASATSALAAPAPTSAAAATKEAVSTPDKEAQPASSAPPAATTETKSASAPAADKEAQPAFSAPPAVSAPAAAGESKPAETAPAETKSASAPASPSSAPAPTPPAKPEESQPKNGFDALGHWVGSIFD